MIFGNIILYKKREEGRFYVSLINLVLQSNVFTLINSSIPMAPHLACIEAE